MTAAVQPQLSYAEVQKAMAPIRDLEKRIRNRVLTKVARAGGKVQLDELRRRLPRNRGLLKRSTAQKVRQKGVVAFSVSGQKKGAKYPKTKYKAHGGICSTGYPPPLHLAIGAVQPHAIPGRIRLRFFQTSGKKLKGRAMTVAKGRFAARVKHPGKRANPVFQDASRQSMGSAQSACARKATEKIAKEAKAAADLKSLSQF